MQQALAPAPPPPMQHSAQDQPGQTIEMSLREHLLAAQATQAHQGIPTTHESLRPTNSLSPHDGNIDPAIAGPGYTMSAGESGGDDHPSENKRGKRELSTSKRAAQNRAAQRAFRQRKEGYIKKLEQQVGDLAALEDNYKAVQAENYQLRDYIINLQSRLLESQGEYPQPPPSIELPHPQLSHNRTMEALSQINSGAPTTINAPTAPMAPSAVSQLQEAAAQAGELNNGKHHHEEASYLSADYPDAKRQKSEGAPGAENGLNGA